MRVALLPVAGWPRRRHQRAIGPRGGDVPTTVGTGEVDWLCSECGFPIFVGLEQPTRLRQSIIRCPSCSGLSQSRI
jgi:DNA-directed RNA polymerase subunit RPC12/RpoP